VRGLNGGFGTKEDVEVLFDRGGLSSTEGTSVDVFVDW
jgi:hypothetical protein